MAAPFRSGQALGWLVGLGNTATSQLNAASNQNWYAVSFVADSARTLSAAYVYVSAVANANLASTDITCDLYDSSGTGGQPGSSIETGKLPSATITAAGWYNFTGFSTVMVAGQQYWLVFKNVNAAQATNNCTFRNITSLGVPYIIGNSLARQGWGIATSGNAGSSWALSTARVAARISYADGTYDGMTMSNVAAAGVGDGVYGARESGVKFTSPLYTTLRVAGVAMGVGGKSGSPTGSPRIGLWTGSTPTNLAYATLPSTAITGGQWVYGYFGSIQTILPGTVCIVTLGETTQSDASGNRFNNYEFTVDTDSNSTPLLPMNGTALKTYYNGSTWADSTLGTSLFGFALLLDTAQEFASIPIGHITGARSIGTY